MHTRITLIILLLVGIMAMVGTVGAQCVTDAATTPIDNGADNVTCSGNMGNTNTQGGNDTIILNGVTNGTINASTGDDIISAEDTPTGGLLLGGTGNDTITLQQGGVTMSIYADNGVVPTIGDNDTITVNGSTLAVYIFAGGGADSIINTGNGSTLELQGEGGNDTIVNTGDFTFSWIFGDDTGRLSSGDDSIINSGAFDTSYIMGGVGNDNITNSGAFTNSAIAGDRGDDTITLLPGSSFDVNSFVDGDVMNQAFGIQDLLILHSASPIQIPDLTPCHRLPDLAAMQANGCFVPWEGGTLYFVNFEQIQVVLIQALAEQGIILNNSGVNPAGSGSPLPQGICDDSAIKVFKLPNGDVEYYSGFDLFPPNGFLVGKVTLLELANGVRRFQDVGGVNPGWYVVIMQTGNALSGQVFDQNGNPIGNQCPF